MELSRADAGTRRVLSAGEDIAITLPENASTGYRWSLDSTDDFEEISNKTTAPSTVPGAAGARTFLLVPRRSGQLRLRFVKRRRWEQTVIDVFLVDLDVARPE